jgi:hypothetical protein
MNNREPYGWPFRALARDETIEVGDIDAVADRMHRYVDQSELDKLSIPDALGQTLNDFLTLKGCLTHCLRRVGTEDAQAVARYVEKTVAETIVAGYAILLELKNDTSA